MTCSAMARAGAKGLRLARAAHELDGAEQAAAANVADVVVVAEPLGQQAFERLATGFDIGDQGVLVEDALHL